MTPQTLDECLSQQLSEIELLKSMYPGNGDIIFSDNYVIKTIQTFLNSKERTEFVPNHIDFVLNLNVNKYKLEIYVNLPSFYPNEDPDVYVRCNQLNRQQETNLNMGLSTFLKSNHEGEVCIYTAITWVQDHIEDLVNIDNLANTESVKNDDLTLKQNPQFCRLWIYSHHIYNKKKRDEIVTVAKEYNLTGFCLPGKPGIICVEGDQNDCQEWWKIIKSLSWKKIMVRKSDVYEAPEGHKQQKFKGFYEINFQNPASKHTDFSEFSKYIDGHGLVNDFNEFFGLCNS